MAIRSRLGWDARIEDLHLQQGAEAHDYNYSEFIDWSGAAQTPSLGEAVSDWQTQGWICGGCGNGVLLEAEQGVWSCTLCGQVMSSPSLGSGTQDYLAEWDSGADAEKE